MVGKLQLPPPPIVLPMLVGEKILVGKEGKQRGKKNEGTGVAPSALHTYKKQILT